MNCKRLQITHLINRCAYETKHWIVDSNSPLYAERWFTIKPILKKMCKGCKRTNIRKY